MIRSIGNQKQSFLQKNNYNYKLNKMAAMKEDPKKPKGKSDTGQKAIKKAVYSRLVKEKEKMDKSKADVVTERRLMPKFIDTERGRMAEPGSDKSGATNEVMTERKMMPKFIDAERERMANIAGSGKSSAAEAIKEGLFIEKDGDLHPTAKYQQMKKSGQLKGKFNIN